MITEAEKALQAYRESSYHARLNIMTEFFENTLPRLIESSKRKEELERYAEARNIVTAASERKDADTRTSGERREGAVFAGE